MDWLLDDIEEINAHKLVQIGSVVKSNIFHLRPQIKVVICLALAFPTDLLHPYPSSWVLRSAGQYLLVISKSRRKLRREHVGLGLVSCDMILSTSSIFVLHFKETECCQEKKKSGHSTMGHWETNGRRELRVWQTSRNRKLSGRRKVLSNCEINFCCWEVNMKWSVNQQGITRMSTEPHMCK